MKRQVLAVVVCVLAAINFTSADTIRGINIDFVNIGHAGNTADTRVMSDGTFGFGAVAYSYRIGQYEVTNSQWNAFSAVAGVPSGNPSTAYDQLTTNTGTQQPTNNVSWYEAAQFCNWLTSGNKSMGAYQLGTDGSIIVNRAAAIAIYGTTYVIPTEDEWYKAAYFKPDGSGYSLYANGTNTAPIAGTQSNYHSIIGNPWNVGSGTMEQNGTYDMMANVFEWNETLINGLCAVRGGSYYSTNDTTLATSYRSVHDYPYMEHYSTGFRVAAIPEPATMVMLGLGGIFLQKRKN